VIGFFGILLPPLKITHGRFQNSNRILEAPETSIAAIAKESSNLACAVVVVDGKPTSPTTTTPVTYLDFTDGTAALLFVQERLVLLAGETLSASLLILVDQNQAVATKVLPVIEARKLFAYLLLVAAFAHRHTPLDTTVFNPMKSLTD
jgi:hypothetical protein